MAILISLLILCFAFLVMNWFLRPKRFWPQFMDSSPRQICNTDHDCPASQKCFGGKCMETLSQTCDPHTGFWTLTDDQKKLKCVCKKPTLITQSIDGGNCAVNIGCGIYGKVVSLDPFKCQCRDLFKMNARGQCVGRTEIDREPERNCPSGFLLSSTVMAKRFFHPDYLKQFKHAKCLKVPCTFDVLNDNKPLEHSIPVLDTNTLDPKAWRCLCPPEYGHFGVHLDVSHYIHSMPGSHNACASIYKQEPNYPTPFGFEFYCYFYLEGIPQPVCFLLFHKLTRDDGLSEPFKGKKAVAIFDQWPHSYDQKVLQSMQVFHRKRYCTDFKTIFDSHLPCHDETNEEIMNIQPCASTPNEPYTYNFAAFTNNVYRDHFVCRLPHYLQSEISPVVVNPWAIDYRDGDYFSHGYQLMKDDLTRMYKLKPAPTPYVAFLPLDDKTSQKLLGHKWARNSTVYRYPIHF